MTDLADLLANDPLPNPSRAKAKHPTGWEPHVEESGTTAKVVTQPVTTNNPDHATLLSDSGLNPDLWHIDGDLQVRRWQQRPGGEWLRYFKFTAKRGSARPDADVAAQIKLIRSHRSKRPRKRPVTDARVVAIADWQAGKSEGGGSQALTQRALQLIDDVAEMLRAEKPSLLIVATLGDLVENCQGFYAQQTFSVDLDRRGQTTLVRNLLRKALSTWAPLVPRVVVTCVPGNHGENRMDGKSFTTFADNDDVAVVEQVRDILSENPASYGHVKFVIPNDELVVTLDVAGTIIAFAHGHQFSGGANAQAKAFKWWEGQDFGRRPAGDADVLVSGHFHHFCHINRDGRHWIQAPALDGGSKWFAERTGQGAGDDAGTLTFTVSQSGIDHVRVI